MNYLPIIKAILVFVLAIVPLNTPKYCTVHKTLDFCYQQQDVKDGGGGEKKH